MFGKKERKVCGLQYLVTIGYLHFMAIAVTYSTSKILFIQAKLADIPADEYSHLDRNKREISGGNGVRCGVSDYCDE